MRWWQNAFSSSTSSSSASSLSSKVHSDDSLITSSGGGGIRYTLKSAFFFARRRRHARAKKLQNLSENDVDDWRSHYSENENLSSSKCSSSSDRRPPPQPLPLPELQLLLRHDADAAVSNEPSVPLPSPTDAHNSHHKTGDERDRDTHKDGVAHGRLSSQDARKKKKEHLGSRLSKKTPQKLHVTDRVSDIRISAPISAPTTPYASPGLSPLKAEDFLSPNCMAFPGAFQVCSAPEMPPSDTPHYPGFSYKVIPEKNAYSVDNSPHQSPRTSPQRCRKIASGSTSPLHNLLPNESAAARRECSAQGNVHPLPLPPLGATPSQQSTAIPPVSPNAELMPIKGQWQKGKLIGRGTFGSVYVASNRETGALCAMKEVELLPDDPKSAESIRQLQQDRCWTTKQPAKEPKGLEEKLKGIPEINVLSQLKHPNIVQYYGSEIVGDRFYIYLEYVHPGSINKFIHDHCGAITESIVRNFTRHILCGLAYLHSKKTIHRDIKGANLLVDAYGVVKLADFGMAKHLNGQAANLSLKGSPYWMAPELLQSVMQKDTNSDLAFATDIWSLGCTVIEMLNGKPPWSEYEAVHGVFKKSYPFCEYFSGNPISLSEAAAMFKVLKDTPPIPETLSPEGKDFLRWCFCRNPAERPSASMLLEHRFMRISHQPDVPSFLKPVGGVRIKEKLNSQKKQTAYNLDQGRLSLER